MKQILIATTNPGKVRTTKKILAKLGYDGLSFSDLNLSLKEPIETKPTAEAIAAEKAIGYARQFKRLPGSCLIYVKKRVFPGLGRKSCSMLQIF